MAMQRQTSRGATLKGGTKAVTSPFMDNGIFKRISITVDNSYNRGRIPIFPLGSERQIFESMEIHAVYSLHQYRDCDLDNFA